MGFAAYPRVDPNAPSEKLTLLERAYTKIEYTIYLWFISILLICAISAYWRSEIPLVLSVVSVIFTFYFGLQGFVEAGEAEGRNRAVMVLYGLISITFGFLLLVLFYARIAAAMKPYGITQRFAGEIDRKQLRSRILELRNEEFQTPIQVSDFKSV